jgi:hypothetical protein
MKTIYYILLGLGLVILYILLVFGRWADLRIGAWLVYVSVLTDVLGLMVIGYVLIENRLVYKIADWPKIIFCYTFWGSIIVIGAVLMVGVKIKDSIKQNKK